MILANSRVCSKIFRPWDGDQIDVAKQKKNKLRKIRSRIAINQDCTVSTTTLETPSEEKIAEKIKHYQELSRQRQAEERLQEENCALKLASPVEPCKQEYPYSIEGMGSRPENMYSAMELAQSLGIPPTDPLLLESFAQGYAMELEYARIMHQESQTKIMNARKQRPKKYKCPHCDVGFSNNGQLKGHIRIHTGERPFKCDDKDCGKTFTRNEELTRHRRIHSGLRPYPCGTCGKKFGRRDHLKKHTRTHLVQAERMMPIFLPVAPGYPYLYGY